jgi:methyltransferase (TIGR00027 family)
MERTGSGRFEGDTWDPASSVGATATGVAASRALASKGANPLIDDPFAEPLVRAVGVDVFVKLANGEIDLTDDPALSQSMMAEGMAVRTRYFDDFFTSASREGLRQAVILASGLDARTYRLPWPAGTVVYEVDQPQVIEFKTRTLAELGAEPAATLRAVGIDLRDDWPTALRANGFDTSQPTAWIAEGLLVYLPPDAQDRLFDNITALSAPGSRLATEQVPNMDAFSDEKSQERRERMRRLLNVDMSELVYHGERNHVIDYLTTHGWDVTARDTPELYAANGFTLPDDDTGAAMTNVQYISATLQHGA